MWHLIVRTASGAMYLFRWNTERTYVTSTGSSTGDDYENMLVDPTSVAIALGQRMVIREPRGGYPIRYTASVVYWELGRVDRDLPWVTSHDTARV